MAESASKLASLLHDHGELWQIEHQLSPCAWVAVSRPQPSALVLHCAHSLDELRAKIKFDSGGDAPADATGHRANGQRG